MGTKTRRLTLGLLAVLAGSALAFNGHRVAEGPLRLTIGEVEAVTAYDTPAGVPVTVQNTGTEPLSVELEVTDLVDQWRVVGSGTQLVAPIVIGDNAYIASGSVITGEVPPYALALGRARQENKEGWVIRKGLAEPPEKK